MKKYGLHILFILLLAITILLVHNKRSERLKGDEHQFAVKDTGQISFIEIRSPEETVILERMQGNWMINGKYYASNKKMNGLLNVICRLQVSAPIPGSIRYEMIDKLEKEGKRVTIVTDQKHPIVILMYHDTIYSDATYMMQDLSNQPFRVGIPGFQSGNLETLFMDEVNYWRDNSIFRFRADEIQSLTVYDNLQPENSFHLVKDFDDGFKLFTYADSAEVADVQAESITQYLSYFSSVSFERFLSDNEKTDSSVLNTSDPVNIITVRDSRNYVTQVKTFMWYVQQPDGTRGFDLNRLVVMINDTDVVVATYVELDPVIKEIGYFLEGI